MPWLNNINLEWFQFISSEINHIISLDNQFTIGGQGSLISNALCDSKLNHSVTLHKVGINEKPISGTNDEVLQHHGITASKIMSILNSI
jgi:transketolase C-terminal domain/subunit